MLDQLKDLVKQYAGEPVINNPDIPNEHNDEVVAEASNSIFDGLKNAVAGGNLSDLTSMFQGGGDAAPQSAVAQNIQGGFVEKLMHKFGLDQGKAAGIASTLIPLVLKKFVNKTNDPSDNSFDLGKIISGLSGGNNPLSGLTGGDNKEGEGGGLMDKVKGLFN